VLLTDEQLLRYSRHILLPAVDLAGQEALCQARVLVVGLGGLGSAAALYLAAAGVENLWLADDDQVELSNLQRQIAHNQTRLGMNKAQSAQLQIQALNPWVRTQVISERLQGELLARQVQAVDLVLDCSDNFSTRHAINRACWQAKVPLVSGAAIGFDAQISVFNPRQALSPCYHCLYPDTEDHALSCSQSGVVSPLVGMIGSYQALEAVKLLTGAGTSLCGRLQLFDGLRSQWRELVLSPDPACPVCQGTGGA
jgi:molybdopterin-synthase adenylyltransferase